MDGTLVDTEPYWMNAEIRLVERFGGSWTHEDALQMVGKGLSDSASILRAAGVELGLDEIVDALTVDVMQQISEQGVPFRDGAPQLLAALRDAGIPTALVTMSLRTMAEFVVSRIDFTAFDLIVAGDDVARPKPHPDAYLAAAEGLGVDPADCVAIEDSPTGLRAAMAAGVPAIGVPHIVSLDEVGADALWPTLEGRNPADLVEFHASVRGTAASAEARA